MTPKLLVFWDYANIFLLGYFIKTEFDKGYGATNDSDYIAIDFYDGSVIYDFDMHKTTICDIDFYEKKPVTNTMGRMWGSSRFMSPEEYQLRADIDEITNVYLMGATAFVLLGGELDCSFDRWEANKALLEVASKAVCKYRKERFQSIDEFISAWNFVKR